MAFTSSAVDPYFVNNTLLPNELRYAMSALVGKSPTDALAAETGVLPGTASADPFSLTSNGGTTSGNPPRVSVAPGHCIVQTAAGGTYVCTWPAAANVALTLQAGSPRIDVLCARVRDTDVDASGAKTFDLITVDGTPASSPSAPSVPAGYVPLWNILVATSGSLSFTDRRSMTRTAGGVRSVAATDLARAGSHQRDLRIQANGQLDVYLGSTWTNIASPAVWSQFTPTLTTAGDASGVPVGSGSAIGRYIVIGKVMHLRYVFRVGSGAPAAGWGDISTALPAGIVSAPSEETQILAKLNAHWPIGTLQGIYLGKCFIPPSSTQMNLYFPFSSARCDLGTYQMSNAAGGPAGTGRPLVAGGYPAPGILVIQGTIEIT